MSSQDPVRPGQDLADRHVRGGNGAVVTLVEYGDFECPNCQQACPAVKFLLAHHVDEIRFAFRNFPLSEVHPHAELAAEAAEAAGMQGRFWEFHDLLFAHAGELRTDLLFSYAGQLGLDLDRFESELDAHVHLARVRADRESGRRAGVRGTPAFLLDGNFVDVSFGVERLDKAVHAALRARA